jgi:hypothetical protein
MDPALFANIRQGRKFLPGTNTLAYFILELVMKKKSILTWKNVLILLTLFFVTDTTEN